MIVSHKHRFIFLKTRKTAGTSIELALRPYLGPQDIITPLAPEDEAFSDVEPQNYAVERPGPQPRGLWGRLRQARPKVIELSSHALAKDVAEVVGPDVWNGYFKFAFERNPWDRTVSDCFFYKDRKNSAIAFEEFVRRRAHRLDNRSVYSIDRQVIVDRLYKYETLADGFADACARIGIEPPSLPRAKSTQRYDRRHYSAHYTEETAATVERLFSAEIEHLGYSFEKAA